MKLKRFAGVAAALLLGLSMAGPALAVDPPPADSEDFDVEVLAGTEFSVELLNADTSWNDVQFTLGNPGNYSNSVSFDLEVVDMRGTALGWDATAEASDFDPEIPVAQLWSGNNGDSFSCYSPDRFCYTAGSIFEGVAVTPGAPDLLAGPASLISGEGGYTSLHQSKSTGTFTTEEAVFYAGFPNGLAADTYTTTITVTLTSGTGV